MNAIIHRDLKVDNILVKQGRYMLAGNIEFNFRFWDFQKIGQFLLPKYFYQMLGNEYLYESLTAFGVKGYLHIMEYFHGVNCMIIKTIVILQICYCERSQKQPKNSNLLRFEHKSQIFKDDIYSWFFQCYIKKYQQKDVKIFNNNLRKMRKRSLNKIKSSFSQICDSSELFKTVLNPQGSEQKRSQAIRVQNIIVKQIVQGVIYKCQELTWKTQLQTRKQNLIIKLQEMAQRYQCNIKNKKQIIKTDCPQIQDTIIQSIISYNLEERDEEPTNSYQNEHSEEYQLFDQIFQLLESWIIINNQNFQFLIIQRFSFINMKNSQINNIKDVFMQLIYLTFKRFDHSQTNQITLNQFEQVLSQYYQKYIYHINYVILTQVETHYLININKNQNKNKQGMLQNVILIQRQIHQDITQEQIELAFDYFCSINLQIIYKWRFIEIVELYQKKIMINPHSTYSNKDLLTDILFSEKDIKVFYPNIQQHDLSRPKLNKSQYKLLQIGLILY
ncbi:hypothetical protein pb186bvf_002644 [Paramecium bursaria]